MREGGRGAGWAAKERGQHGSEPIFLPPKKMDGKLLSSPTVGSAESARKYWRETKKYPESDYPVAISDDLEDRAEVELEREDMHEEHMKQIQEDIKQLRQKQSNKPPIPMRQYIVYKQTTNAKGETVREKIKGGWKDRGQKPVRKNIGRETVRPAA